MCFTQYKISSYSKTSAKPTCRFLGTPQTASTLVSGLCYTNSAISAALNSDLCLVRVKTLESACLQSACVTVKKMPWGKKLWLIWNSLHVVFFFQESQSCTACLPVSESSFFIFSIFIVVFIRRKSSKQTFKLWLDAKVYHRSSFWLSQV